MIEVVGLQKRFGPTEAVRQVDLTVNAGECFGLIGPNGAGKTTTLKALATLIKPDRGTLTIDGIDVVAEPRRVRRVVGYMPDIFQSYGDLKVIHYLDYYAALAGLEGDARVRQVEQVLELVDLLPKKDSQVGGLSRGVKQRLCLAKTLLHDPKVLLLDEPASGLDPRARIEIRVLLKVLRGMGKTVVISSHILEDLEEICDRVAVIEAGRCVAVGEVATLKERTRRGRRFIVEPRGDIQAIREKVAARADLVTEATVDGRRLRITPAVEDEARIVRLLLDEGVSMRAFYEEVPDLHEVFLELTSGEVT